MQVKAECVIKGLNTADFQGPCNHKFVVIRLMIIKTFYQ